MNKEEYYNRIEKINNKVLTDRVSKDEEISLICQKNYLRGCYIDYLEKENKKQKEIIDKAIKILDIIIYDLEEHEEALPPTKEELYKVFGILKEVSE